MRVYIVLAILIFLFACVSATENDTPLLTHSLTAGQTGRANKRLLRSTRTGEEPEGEERGAVSGLGNLAEKARFWFWKAKGKTPGMIYEKFFKNIDSSKIIGSRNHKLWSNYEKWFNKKQVAAITAAANAAA
ncbi:hypothetical protein PF005_g28991 [Phytophthora fragariae]|uniref:RxLR effector protein n=1 Tax=Phytophthora fragariae TaxID=53985 RepID=A0A6A3VUY1_9STRA|nr:hypothetical protein PF003_g37440 [Phytophthora fragariae]KAE8919995.1 hypothetical protein PF009_g29706 [Phytophthora fragariae]KAE8965529.1 hypothetical protein PF011_g28256 [Phytophthora fragariae]KAE9063885.1 hypothetical protein PF010_g28821 [Phytophthora fragariae]KAE9064649.1 hypothetical protein PF007_g29121 [Phytophthora fragariae]